MAEYDKNCSLVDYIKSSDPTCNGFELENSRDSFTIVDLVDEHLNIGAATVNVFKLLGIHEQGKLLDVTGNGTALSGGDGPGFAADNAYNKLCGVWRSIQRGSEVLTHAFLGYDFGAVAENRDGLAYYGDKNYVHKHITTIRVKQGSNKRNRASKVRLERSFDGFNWFGVGIAALPDNGDIHQITFKGSAASRFWRIRPVAFNGGPMDFWEVARFEMHEYEETHLSNLQYDGAFLENRDRDYAEISIPIKMYYDLADIQTEMTQIGMELDSHQLSLTVSFKQTVTRLNRPIVIGDILEMPTEIQYTSDLKAVIKYMEVIDVAWSSEGYTPGWQPTLQRIIAVPMIASQETMDITERKKPSVDDIGFIDVDTENVQDFTHIFDRAISEQDAAVPLRGKDITTLRHFSDEEIANANANGISLEVLNHAQRAVYAEDGIPPNNEPYTEGDSWPKNPTNGDWHRLTYSAATSPIPAKLFKYNSSKGRWVYYETDRRTQYDMLKPSIQEALIKLKQKSVKNNEQL